MRGINIPGVDFNALRNSVYQQLFIAPTNIGGEFANASDPVAGPDWNRIAQLNALPSFQQYLQVAGQADPLGLRAVSPSAGYVNPNETFANLGYQTGGWVPGVGSGDIMPMMLEPGELVVRRDVAQQYGTFLPELNRSGQVSGGAGVNIQNLVINVSSTDFADDQKLRAKARIILDALRRELRNQRGLGF